MLERREVEDPTATADNWIYFKLYVGRASDRLDGFILDLVPRLLAFGELDRWFFLRYVDQGGVHLRLRLQVRSGAAADRVEPARRLCEEALERIPQLAPSHHRPMVMPPGFDPHGEVPIANAVVYLDRQVYEPELDKFGGKEGMPIAEALFEASSLVAYECLKAEIDGGISRKTLAPCFMALVASAFLPPSESAQFWRSYCLYWLGGSTSAAEDWRDRFLRKSGELEADGTPVIMPESTMSPEAKRLLKEWQGALQVAAEGYRALVGDAPSAEVLAFNFAHLMNNRIGLLSLEEAYLAALLERWTERVAA